MSKDEKPEMGLDKKMPEIEKGRLAAEKRLPNAEKLAEIRRQATDAVRGISERRQPE